jgi:hypothetical protein
MSPRISATPPKRTRYMSLISVKPAKSTLSRKRHHLPAKNRTRLNAYATFVCEGLSSSNPRYKVSAIRVSSSEKRLRVSPFKLFYFQTKHALRFWSQILDFAMFFSILAISAQPMLLRKPPISKAP